jgi:hypothetical protein
MLDSSGTHSLSQNQKNQKKIATEQIKTATRLKLITFKTRETKNKALKMKNRKSSKSALTTSNLKCHIIYFSPGFHNNQWESAARMFEDITNTIYDTLLIF